MSSTGRVSKVFVGAMTSLGEDKRKEEIDKAAAPSLFETVRETEAVISEVHDDKLLVKAYQVNSGAVIGNNRWIPLSHSPQEIAERFGTIRPGMVIKVSYQGPEGLNARAMIVANEQEKTGEEDFNLNELETGLFEIFKPGA